MGAKESVMPAGEGCEGGFSQWSQHHPKPSPSPTPVESPPLQRYGSLPPDDARKHALLAGQLSAATAPPHMAENSAESLAQAAFTDALSPLTADGDVDLDAAEDPLFASAAPVVGREAAGGSVVAAAAAAGEAPVDVVHTAPAPEGSPPPSAAPVHAASTAGSSEVPSAPETSPQVDDAGPKDDKKPRAPVAFAADIPSAQQAFDAYCGQPGLYELVKPIGCGAYGAVYLAKDPRTGQKVALKQIINAFTSLTDARRIYREIKVMKHFTHPNIVQLLHVVRPANTEHFEHIYLVSELMETDMHRVIHSRQDLTSEHISYFLYQALCALKHMHSARVLHRDLKPSNLLVNSNCHLMLCDFGLARESNHSQTHLTEYVVTRWYRAPEVLLSGGKYTEAIDVWSMGCILAELLLRRPMFPGDNYLHQLQLITETLGSPTEDDLHFVTSPPARNYMLKLPHSDGSPIPHLFPHVRGPCLDLLARMLVFDPVKRITVEEALAHPFLARVRAARRGTAEDPHPTKFRIGFRLKKLEVSQISDRFLADLTDPTPGVEAAPFEEVPLAPPPTAPPAVAPKPKTLAPSDAQAAAESVARARGLSAYVESTRGLQRRDSSLTDVSSDGSEAYEYYQDCYDEGDFEDAAEDPGSPARAVSSTLDLSALQGALSTVLEKLGSGGASEELTPALHSLYAAAVSVNPVVLQQLLGGQVTDPAVAEYITAGYTVYMQDVASAADRQRHRYYSSVPLAAPGVGGTPRKPALEDDPASDDELEDSLPPAARRHASSVEKARRGSAATAEEEDVGESSWTEVDGDVFHDAAEG